MGTSRTNLEDFFSVDSRIDISRVGEVSLFYKHVQHWKTARKLMLNYGPTSIPMTEYQKHATDLLVELEKNLVKHKPEQFSADIHDKEWPEGKCILNWAKGTPFVEQIPGQRQEDTSHCKTPTLVYPREDEERIMKVARESKYLKLERSKFGQHAFFKKYRGRRTVRIQRKRMQSYSAITEQCRRA